MPTSEPTDVRVERWARELDPNLWSKVDGAPTVLDPATIGYGKEDSLRRARAAIALSDQEAAERVEANEASGAVPEEPVAWRCKTVNGLGWAYLTEHSQGVQMGPEWEPLYATTPRPASATKDAMNVWICDDFEGYYPVGTAAVVAAETEDEARELLDAKLKEHGLPQSGSVSIYRFSQDKPQAYII